MEFLPDEEERRFAEAFASVADEYDWPAMAAMRREIRDSDVERNSVSFLKRLAAAKLLGIYWPEPYGHAASVVQALLFRERVESEGFPGYGIVSDEAAAGLMIKFGTEAQRAEHLPRIITGEWHYARGLSEPDAGSDLLALTTTARRSGDHYVVNGTKLWTSGAHIADWIHCVVRTDATAVRQAGLSMLLVPTNAPGLDIRPVHVMGGWRVNECFFTDVRVPVTNLIGEENHGWQVVTGGLDAERAMSFGGNETRLLASRLVHRLAGVEDLDGADLERLGHFITELEADRLLYLRVGLQVQRGDAITGTAPMSKINGSELAQEFTQWAADLVGAETLFPIAAGERCADQLAADLEEQLRVATVLTIIGGTSEVQRNTVARQSLNLPRGS